MQNLQRIAMTIQNIAINIIGMSTIKVVPTMSAKVVWCNIPSIPSNKPFRQCSSIFRKFIPICYQVRSSSYGEYHHRNDIASKTTNKEITPFFDYPSHNKHQTKECPNSKVSAFNHQLFSIIFNPQKITDSNSNSATKGRKERKKIISKDYSYQEKQAGSSNDAESFIFKFCLQEVFHNFLFCKARDSSRLQDGNLRSSWNVIKRIDSLFLINPTPVANVNNKDNQFSFSYLTNYPIISDPISPESLKIGRQRFAKVFWVWGSGKFFQIILNFILGLIIQLSNRFNQSWTIYNFPGHFDSFCFSASFQNSSWLRKDSGFFSYSSFACRAILTSRHSSNFSIRALFMNQDLVRSCALQSSSSSSANSSGTLNVSVVIKQISKIINNINSNACNTAFV